MQLKVRRYVVLGAIALAILGCFLPWLTGEAGQLTGFAAELGRPGAWVLPTALLRLGMLPLWGKWVRVVNVFAALSTAFWAVDAIKEGLRIEAAVPGVGAWCALLAGLLFLVPTGEKMEAHQH